MKLMESIKISQAITPAAGAAGTEDIEATIVDMQDFDGLLVLVTSGAVTPGALTSIKARQGEDVAMSDAQDILGTNQTISDDDDNRTFYMEILNPKERYVQLVVSRGVQNAAIASALYVQYKASRLPVTAQGTGIEGESFTAPFEGTA